MNTTAKDLDDPLDELFAIADTATPRPVRAIPAAVQAALNMFVESCAKCHGRGQFVSWSGRVLGPCFACKGKGKAEFKTSAADRAKARQGAADRKVAKAEAAVAAFAAEHPAEHAWMVANPTFEFAASMLTAVQKWGSLTEKQIDAVRRCIARDGARKAAKAERTAAAPTVDTTKIEAAFATARQAAAKDREGLKWLRLRLDTFVLSDAPANGQWPAAIFIKEGATKLGRITGGKLLCSPDTSPATRDRILAAIDNPAAAAKAFGQRTGSCSICGRELTNADSRKLGIGPICAERFGF